MTLAQVCALVDEEAAMKRRARRPLREERQATVADLAMLTRFGLPTG